MNKKKLKIFTWNVHSGYLFNLIKTGHDFYVPIKPGRPYNYAGKNDEFKWPKNIHNLKLSEIKKKKFDILILQNPDAFYEQSKVLSKSQQKLPKIYLQHTAWRKYRRIKKAKWLHYLTDIDIIVHITRFTRDQWIRRLPSTRSKCRIVYHSTEIPKNIVWNGRIKKAITANNELQRIECGPEIWKAVSKKVPIDLYGTRSEEFGGLGFIKNTMLRKKFADYRAYFNSTTASPLPMAVLEAMSVGLPVVTTATTELPRVISKTE